MIFGLLRLRQVLLCRLPTGNDRLQDDQLVVFDEGNEVHVVVTLYDEDPLTAVSFLVGVFKDVQRMSSFDEEDDFLEPDGSLGLQCLVLRPSQVKYFTYLTVPHRVPDEHTLESE
jgi:hypothetical protein